MIALLLASAALAVDAAWEVGLGTRDSATEPWHAEGVRALVRRSWGGFALELDLYGTPSTHRDWGREDPYDWDPYVESHVDLDQASLALLADQGLARDRRAGPRARHAPPRRRTPRRAPRGLGPHALVCRGRLAGERCDRRPAPPDPARSDRDPGHPGRVLGKLTPCSRSCS